MDRAHETGLVRAFFLPRVQERFLHELSEPRKRKKAIDRLSSYHLLFNPQFCHPIPKPNSNSDKLAEMLRGFGAGDLCYCLSFIDELDGKYFPLVKALEQVVGAGMPSILSLIPGQLVYFEGEQCYGPPDRLVLKR